MKEVRTTSVSGGEKGVKKQRYELIPPAPLREVALLYGRGALKYHSHNFRKGYEWSKTYGALQRHANLFWSGETMDQEMQLNHLASVAWHAMALTEFQSTHTVYDNRPGKTMEGGQTTTLGLYEGGFPHVDVEAGSAGEGELKPRYDLIPVRPLALLAEAYGALPDVPENITWSSLYTKLQEHANLFWSGGDACPHTGVLHTVHVLRYALELLNLKDRPDLDDRLIDGAAPIGFDSNPA